MPPPPRPARDARERIQRAAHRLFAERGPEEVTMAEVAAAAGVARATVFNHFGSKHALLESMTARVLLFYRALLEDALADPCRSTPDLIRELFEVMADGIEAERRFHRAVFREIARLALGIEEGGPGTEARLRAADTLVKLFARGQARGDITKAQPPETLAAAFTSLVDGTITRWLFDDDSHPLRERMGDAANVFLGPVATRPDAGASDASADGD